MGKKAKIRQLKREKQTRKADSPRQQIVETDFIKELQHQGYQLEKPIHSPEIPENKIKPQI